MTFEVIDNSILGNIAAVIMLFGYICYATFLFRNKTEANATTWTLTSIGSLTLIISEFLYGVPWNALKADAVDTIAAVIIAVTALLLGNYTRWTSEDKKLVFWYFALLILYLFGDYMSRDVAGLGVWVLLISTGVIILYNITSVLEFIPIMRETWNNPQNELPWAWSIWTYSYTLYLFVRIYEEVKLVNLLHPIISIVIHLTMALLVLPFTRYLLRGSAALVAKRV